MGNGNTGLDFFKGFGESISKAIETPMRKYLDSINEKTSKIVDYQTSICISKFTSMLNAEYKAERKRTVASEEFAQAIIEKGFLFKEETFYKDGRLKKRRYYPTEKGIETGIFVDGTRHCGGYETPRLTLKGREFARDLFKKLYIKLKEDKTI